MLVRGSFLACLCVGAFVRGGAHLVVVRTKPRRGGALGKRAQGPRQRQRQKSKRQGKGKRLSKGRRVHQGKGCLCSRASRHIYKELQSILSWVAIVPGSLVFISLLYYCFEISNIYLSLLLVFPMGVFPGSC
jgi:hypothetical protein